MPFCMRYTILILLKLRHTYLRVLNPLLTKTQLRSVPYKRPQIVMTLESLIHNTCIRDINPTTKRLVERCLSGEWCVQLRKEKKHAELDEIRAGMGSPSSEGTTALTQTHNHLLPSAEPSMSTALHLERTASIGRSRTLKTSKSMEFHKGDSRRHKHSPCSPTERLRSPINTSSLNLGGVISTSSSPTSPLPASPTKHREKSHSAHVDGNFGVHRQHQHDHAKLHCDNPPLSARSLPSPAGHQISPAATNSTHRRPPPTPPKRRKPPAIPLGNCNDGTTVTTIKSSATSAPPMSSKQSLVTSVVRM